MFVSQWDSELKIYPTLAPKEMFPICEIREESVENKTRRW